MKHSVFTIFIFLILISCDKNSEKKLILLIENKPWVNENLTGIPLYYQNGIEYTWWSKESSFMKGKRLDLYLYKDSPNKPKRNSKWQKFTYYKITNDTLFLQQIDDGKIFVRKLTVLNDTTIGILDYYRIEITALRKEGDSYKKGLIYTMISQK